MQEQGKKERVSRDIIKNTEGKKLTDFCEKNGLLILNGKCEGDREGNFTWTGKDGGSVIDYLIVTDERQTIIKRMKIKIRVKSDHLFIAIKIRSEKRNNNHSGNGKETESQELEIRLMWKEKSKEEYEKRLREEFTQILITYSGKKVKWLEDAKPDEFI